MRPTVTKRLRHWLHVSILHLPEDDGVGHRRPHGQKQSRGHTLTWQGRQGAGVRTRSVRVLGGVLGLQDLMEVEKLSVPPVDKVLAPSFSLHLDDKHLAEEKRRKA